MENPPGIIGDAVIDDFSFCAAPVKLDNPIPESIQPGGIPIMLTTLSSGLTAPNWGTFAPGSPDRLFVTDQVGTLWVIDLVTGDKAIFLDVGNRLVELGIAGPDTFDERGLLGVAFHPDYANNGLLYTYTSEPADGPADFSTIPAGVTANHQTVILEWRVPDPANLASVVDSATVREVLRIDQPQFNHDGGALNFGPDGMLYISLGDGGSADDQGDGHAGAGNGQEPGNILGAILSIDPLASNSANGQYGIPADNPFVGQAGFIDEIFAYGFRNPFRFSFDMENGDMYIADVGQNDIEEIDLGFAGGNYGWNIKEGGFCFNPDGSNPGFVFDDNPCPGAPTIGSLTDPIAQYDHDEGIAVIGGFVYRGAEIPDLLGHYIFGEFSRIFGNNGRLFHLMGGQILEIPLIGRDNFGMSLLGFGQDSKGEVYVLANGTGTPFGDTGVVLRIDSVPIAELSQALFQDPADGATGIRVGIDRVFDPSTGNEVAALLEDFRAQLVYDGGCVNALGFRDGDSSIDDPTIDDTAGIAKFGGITAGGVAAPADLGNVLTRLLGSNQVTCQVTIEVTSLIDDGGNNTGVVPRTLSQTLLRGDAGADGVINIDDALSIAQYLVGSRDACTTAIDATCLHSVNAASVRQDGAFDQKTIADALFIAQNVAGIRDEFYNLVP